MKTFTVLIMLSVVCGASHSGGKHGWIIGGNETTIENHPYQVALIYKDGDAFNCGATVLSTKLILSAAHCKPEKNCYQYYARFGSTSYTEGGVVRDVISWTSHPEFNVTGITENDVAVAEIDGEIPLGPNIAVVALPSADDPAEGELVTLVGWGATDNIAYPTSVNLKEAMVPVFNQDSCNTIYDGRIMESNICVAGEKDGTTGACIGDSGGPAIKDGIQYGITSYAHGLECVYPDIPQVYTRVSSFLDWIAEQMSLAQQS